MSGREGRGGGRVGSKSNSRGKGGAGRRPSDESPRVGAEELEESRAALQKAEADTKRALQREREAREKEQKANINANINKIYRMLRDEPTGLTSLDNLEISLLVCFHFLKNLKREQFYS